MGRTKTQEVGPHLEFAARLRRALNESGLMAAYAAVGKRLGVSPTFVGDMLNGRKLPSTETGIRIALDTGVCFEWLMTGRGPVKVPQGGADGTLQIGHLPRDAQATIKSVVHSFEQSATPDQPEGKQNHSKG